MATGERGYQSAFEAVPPDVRRSDLLELHQHLVHRHAISRPYEDVLHLSRHRGCDIGLHLHRFEHQQKIIRLQLLPDLRIDLDHDACDRTAANLLLVPARSWPTLSRWNRCCWCGGGGHHDRTAWRMRWNVTA